NMTLKMLPKGNFYVYTYNQRDQIVQEETPIDFAAGVSYRTLTWYDANDNVVRIDVENRGENGAAQANQFLSTISEYEILNRVVRTCQENTDADLDDSQTTYASFTGQ